MSIFPKEKHFPVCLCLGVFETFSDPFTYKSISVFGNFYMDSPPTVFDKEYYFAGVLGVGNGACSERAWALKIQTLKEICDDLSSRNRASCVCDTREKLPRWGNFIFFFFIHSISFYTFWYFFVVFLSLFVPSSEDLNFKMSFGVEAEGELGRNIYMT